MVRDGRESKVGFVLMGLAKGRKQGLGLSPGWREGASWGYKKHCSVTGFTDSFN